MATEDALPTVLIIGSVQEGTASALLCYLWGENTKKKPRRASYVRLVDKYLIVPQSDTYLRCWVHPEARKVLKDGHGKGVEYIQANIANADSRTRIFKAPGGENKAFDIVFDFSGGNVTALSTEEIMVEVMAKQARLLGLEALKYGGVGAYVRQVDPFCTQSKKKCPLKESDTEVRPSSLWSKWAWEGSRALADLKDLNLVLARIANPWGAGCLIGLTRRLTVASVYKYLGPSEMLEFLWGKELVVEHVHIDDVASAFFALAQWMIHAAGRNRSKADELAGELLPPARPAVIDPEEMEKIVGGSGGFKFDDVEEIEGLVGKEVMVKAPFFNVTDGSATTQEAIGKIVEKAVGVKVDFYSSVTNALAKMNMSEVVEAAEEKHTEPWLEMLALSKPPINNTPLTPGLPALILRKNRCHLDGSKIRNIVGWTPKYPKITADEVKASIELWQKDGIWPNAKPQKK